MLIKKTILLLGLSVAACNAFAQADDAAKYGAGITGDNLKKHLTIIAGDEMEGRETGTEGQRKAAAYIEAQFKSIGLKSPDALKGYQQIFPLHRDSMTACTVKINDRQLEYGKDYYVPVLNNRSKKAAGNKLVFVGYGISEPGYDDYKDLDVKGKIVVLLLGEPKVNGNYLVSGTKQYSKYTYPGITEKIAVAESKGAVAAVIVNPLATILNSRMVAMNTTSNVYFPGEALDKSIDFISVSMETAKQEFAEWNMDSLIKKARIGSVLNAIQVPEKKASFSFEYKKERQIINASNVLGVIEGTDKKNEFVFLTAHYDHLGKKDGKIYYGADDDGSGTCAVINMAEVFAKAKAEGKGPRRTIVFMTVSGEEKGLWGSEYYSDHPVFPLEKTTVDLNTDMVGRTDTERSKPDSLNYVYVIGHDKVSSELQGINEGVNKKYTNLVLDYKYDDPNDEQRIYYRSDHYNFARKGVPILFFYDGMLKADYHKPTDTVDKINWELYEKRVRMIFYTAWEIANRNDMLKRDIPLPPEE